MIRSYGKDESDLTIDNMNQLANESIQDLEYYQSV